MVLAKVVRKYIIALLLCHKSSMMTISVEHFHSTILVKHILMSQLQYARVEFK